MFNPHDEAADLIEMLADFDDDDREYFLGAIIYLQDFLAIDPEPEPPAPVLRLVGNDDANEAFAGSPVYEVVTTSGELVARHDGAADALDLARTLAAARGESLFVLKDGREVGYVGIGTSEFDFLDDAA